GFGPAPFAKVGEAHISVRLLPLFSHRVEVGTLTLKGLALNLEKSAQGQDNWSDLSKHAEEKEKTETPPAPSPQPSGPPVAFTVGGLQIDDANLGYADKQAGTSYQLQGLNVDIGAIDPGKPMDVKVSFK